MRIEYPEGVVGTAVVKLSTMDMFRLFFGRELSVEGEATVLHWGIGYEALNVDAKCPSPLESAGLTPQSRN